MIKIKNGGIVRSIQEKDLSAWVEKGWNKLEEVKKEEKPAKKEKK